MHYQWVLKKIHGKASNENTGHWTSTIYQYRTCDWLSRHGTSHASISCITWACFAALYLLPLFILSFRITFNRGLEVMNDGASLVIICRISLFLVFLPWIIALHEFLHQERLCSTACLRPFESVELPNNKEVTRHSKKFALIPNCPIRAGSMVLGPGMCLSSWSVNSLTAIILMYLLPGLSYFKSSRSVTAQIIGFAFRAFMLYLVYPYIT